MKPEPLKPCPFCGETDTRNVVGLRGNTLARALQCKNCEACGPTVVANTLDRRAIDRARNKRV